MSTSFKIKISIWLFLLVKTQAFSQLKTVTFEQIDTLSVVEKPIVVYIYTNWCKGCAKMHKTTFENEAVINELNSNYYYIPFNAEFKKTVIFENRKFSYYKVNKRFGVHELAEFLGGHLNRIKYPTIVILNRKKKVVYKHPIRLKAKGFLKLLKEINKHEIL